MSMGNKKNLDKFLKLRKLCTIMLVNKKHISTSSQFSHKPDQLLGYQLLECSYGERVTLVVFSTCDNKCAYDIIKQNSKKKTALFLGKTLDSCLFH